MVQEWLTARQRVNRLERALDRRLRRDAGISLVLYGLLSTAGEEECAPNQQAIADALGLSKGSISRYVDQCVSSGYLDVRVSSGSRREKEVSLTAKGRDVVARGDHVLATLAQDESVNEWLGDLHSPR